MTVDGYSVLLVCLFERVRTNPMRALLIAGMFVFTSTHAPLQCASRRLPETEREESPGEALWRLSERFSAQGNLEARNTTLRFLIERYPSSRFAHRAREALTPPDQETHVDVTRDTAPR